MMHRRLLIVFLALGLGCSNNDRDDDDIKLKTFNALDFKLTGVNFNNKLVENDTMNYFNYTSIYMGGGVSVGDINNDGLVDIFFTGNQVQNKLYINKGNLKFEDVTGYAEVGGDNRWYTGSTMADVNGDGYLDIYCSVAGLSDERRNELYINNQDGTFTNKAEEYRVDDPANSTQGTFFDYDNDGDLDLYVANYPIANVNTPNYIYKNRMQNVSDKESDKLYRNDGDTFTDVTQASGLKSYGFSLGVSAGDLNNDGWQDLYISSDYSIPDYLYINNGDGTFKSVIKEATAHTSFYGMGIDIADVNNDGLLDVFQADMDAMNNRRQKANMSSMNPQVFNEIIYMGFHYQYMHNCFQLNTGVFQNNVPQFSNISRLTGTSSTDWSWAPLFADFDNDGHKDLFITNGVRREINNTDFFNNYTKTDDSDLTDLEKTLKIPSEKIDNFMFKNNGKLDFEKINEEWGIEYEGFSNGVAYADLDNDGDLELIINNIDDFASIYENTSSNTSNFLSIELKGSTKNKFGLGARVFVSIDNETQMQELTLTRGFQSSVAPRLHFGIGDNKTIDELKVVWPNGKSQILNDVKANQFLAISHTDALSNNTNSKEKEYLFTTINAKEILEHKHKENDYDDYLKQILLPHKMSSFGPAIAVGDLNGDGEDDFFVGGSHGNSGFIYQQSAKGFIDTTPEALKKDKLSEDVGAMIFDADADGDNDLYVVSGGYEFSKTSQFYQDRLYLNDGMGGFTRVSLPKMITSGSRPYHADFNKDGKEDILALGRQVPEHYPLPASSYLLINKSEDEKVIFSDETDNMISSLKDIGMATSAVITDFDNDTWQDIIIVGEWMPIRVFKNMKTHFEEVSSSLGITEDSTGWWWSIKAGDFDNDGDQDFIVGNNGLNYKYKASENETFDIYVKDFDNNNSEDIVLSYYSDGKQVPLRGRSCSSQQIPGIKQKFKDYNSFSEATLVDVYTKEELDESLHYQVKSFASIYIENNGDEFIFHQLPVEAQFSSINQVLVEDYNKDGNLDMLVAGNLYVSEVETPRNDAGFGYYLQGNGNGDFKPIPPTESGIFIKGDTKDMSNINIAGEDYIIVAKNDDFIQFIKRL